MRALIPQDLSMNAERHVAGGRRWTMMMQASLAVLELLVLAAKHEAVAARTLCLEALPVLCQSQAMAAPTLCLEAWVMPYQLRAMAAQTLRLEVLAMPPPSHLPVGSAVAKLLAYMPILAMMAEEEHQQHELDAVCPLEGSQSVWAHDDPLQVLLRRPLHYHGLDLVNPH